MEEPEAAADHPTKTRAESMSQEHVTIAKNELELLKQRLQETEDKLKQAEGARQYCVGEAAKHHAEYYADLDKQTSKSRVAFDQIAEMAVENDQLKRSLEERKALGEKLDSSNRSLKLQLEADVSAESSGGPRTRSKRKNEEALRADEAKRNKKGITVTCTRCLALGLQCDNSNTCKRCSSAWKTCKRVKCKRFEVGRCFNGACTFAHEGDQFENLVPFTRIKQVAPENTSRSATKTSDNSSVVKKEYDRDVYGYMALFDEIARRRKGRDGQDDGVAGPPGK